MRAQAVEDDAAPRSVVHDQLLDLALRKVGAAADGAADAAAHRLLLGAGVDDDELLAIVVLAQQRVAELARLDPRESARRDLRAVWVCPHENEPQPRSTRMCARGARCGVARACVQAGSARRGARRAAVGASVR